MFRGLKVFGAQQALFVGDQHLRLYAVDIVVEFLALKFRCIAVVGNGNSIQPDCGYGSVICE